MKGVEEEDSSPFKWTLGLCILDWDRCTHRRPVSQSYLLYEEELELSRTSQISQITEDHLQQATRWRKRVARE